MNFNENVVLVTGAATGIGKATAFAFAGLGAHVAVADKSSEGKNVAEEIKKKGNSAVFCKTDISREFEVTQMVEKVSRQLGEVDILVNNAAIAKEGSIKDITTDEWRNVIDTNLSGAFLCSKYCLPSMEQKGKGVIVNVASVQGIATEQDNASYSASKGGLIALTKSMALDLAPYNIRVNCICPGAVATEGVEQALAKYKDPENARREWSDLHALRRMGTPEEIANVILFLASEDASFITGSPIIVDGGMLAAFGTAGKPV